MDRSAGGSLHQIARLELIAADDSALDTNVAVLDSTTVDMTSYGVSDGAFTGQADEPADPSVSYTAVAADAGQYLGIRLYVQDTDGYAGGFHGTSFDDVRLDAVPEPATMALLGIGGLGVLVRRRRR